MNYLEKNFKPLIVILLMVYVIGTLYINYSKKDIGRYVLSNEEWLFDTKTGTYYDSGIRSSASLGEGDFYWYPMFKGFYEEFNNQENE